MSSLLGQPAFQLFTVAAAILIVEMYALGVWTATLRGHRKAMLHAEDEIVFGRNKGMQVVPVDHPDTQRLRRAHLNALENAVPFFLLGFIYTLTAPSTTSAAIIFCTFVAVRTGHAVFYIAALQPYRSLCHASTMLLTIVLIVKDLSAVF